MLQNSYSHSSINNPIGETAWGNSETAIASENEERFTHWFNFPYQTIHKKNDDSKDWFTLNFRLSKEQIFKKWQNPETLIGLRFGRETNYGLIDVDHGSQYHNQAGLTAIKGALENFGINDTIPLRSSFSEGFHLLYFLPGKVNSYSLACLTEITLKEAGLEVKPGQLEIFPNVKSYSRENPTAFNGHRLPLQPGSGSYLLDDDFQPYSNSIDTFLSQSYQCALSVDFDLLSELLSTARDRHKKIRRIDPDNLVDLFSYKKTRDVKRWQAYIDTTMAAWTSHGDSNIILGAITDKGRVFLGIDDESELVDYILKTAIATPGYFEFCQHQNEIQAWAKRWARCGMKKRWPYGSRGGNGKPKNLSKGGPTNDEKTALTQLKLIECMTNLTDSRELASGVKAREKQLISLLGISRSTLWKPNYLSLWHPKNAITLETSQTQSLQGLEEKSHTPAMNCMGAVVAEKRILISPVLEGSDRVIMKAQTTENQTQENERAHENQSPEINFARCSSLKMPKLPTQQAIKPRQDTEKTVISLVVNHAALEVPKNGQERVLKKCDIVYHVDRPDYPLEVVCVVNDELIKAVTIGWKGAEYFAICELVLIESAIAA